jgi:hypothetical protein
MACTVSSGIWGVARSSFYDGQRQEGRLSESPAGRRGPRPVLGDENLLYAIRRDLARSPLAGEGHRNVWARLRVIEIRISRTRVLRIMGENSLLSPHRRPLRPANDRDGSITTDAPNVMWGADGAAIPTVNVITENRADHAICGHGTDPSASSLEPRTIDRRCRRSKPSTEAHPAGTDRSVVGGEAAHPHGGRPSRGQPAGGVALAAAVRRSERR